ncbi:amino acid--tRNA ligase-related protein [Streptomyces sp. NPDC000405]|uniref:amino acid--tRNA ligase-related protein n=1 Tax=Streptomyces sp. NPDC000405 TaxID=3161033 RepID=UPI00398CF7F3
MAPTRCGALSSGCARPHRGPLPPHLGSIANADPLLGAGEVAGAGERHATAEAVLEGLADHQIGQEPYGWYIEMRERRPLRTSGFGMGVERLLLWVLNHDDIRDLQILVRRNGLDCTPLMARAFLTGR